MDGSAFDALTRRFGGGASRRRVLAGLMGAVAAGVSSRFGANAETGPANCARFCEAVFPVGPERDRCVGEGAAASGLCAACAGNAKGVCRAADGALGCPDLRRPGPFAACVCAGNADCPSDPCHAGLCGPESHACFSVPIVNPDKGRSCEICAVAGDCGGGPCCDGRCCPKGAECRKGAGGAATCCLTCGEGAHGSCCDEITLDERGGFAIELAACQPGSGTSDARDFCCNEIYTMTDGRAMCYGPVGSVR